MTPPCLLRVSGESEQCKNDYTVLSSFSGEIVLVYDIENNPIVPYSLELFDLPYNLALKLKLLGGVRY